MSWNTNVSVHAHKEIQKREYMEPEKLGYSDSPQQFGDSSRKNTWSRTYRKIFRQFLEDETPIDYSELRREEVIDLSDVIPSTKDPFPNVSKSHIGPTEIVIEEEIPFNGHQISLSDSEHNHDYSMRNITRNVMVYEKQCAETEHTTRSGAKAVTTGKTAGLKSPPATPPPSSPAPPPPPPPPFPSSSCMRLTLGSENTDSNVINSLKSTQQSAVHFGDQIRHSKIGASVGYGISSTNNGKRSENKNVSQVLLISPCAQQWNPRMHHDSAELSTNPERVRDSGSVIHAHSSTLTSPNETTMLTETTMGDRNSYVIKQPKFMTSSSAGSDTISSPRDVSIAQRDSDVITSARNRQQSEFRFEDSRYHSDDITDHEFNWDNTRYGGARVEQFRNIDSTHKICTVPSPPQFVETAAFINTSQPEELISVSKRTVSVPTQTETLINRRSSTIRSNSNRQLSYSDERRNSNEQQNVLRLIKMFEHHDGSCSPITRISQSHTKVNEQLNEFMGSYFNNNRPLTVRVREENDLPLQRYWSVKATIDNDEKDADVILEQLLTFVPGRIKCSSCSPYKISTPSNSLKHNGRDFHEYERFMKNVSVCSEKFIDSSEQGRHQNARYTTSMNEAQTLGGDHLSTYQRIHENIPLDCNNLYALKSAHWRLVIPRENQLQKLKRESVVVDEDGSVSYGGNETIVKQIEAELLEDYKRYQDLLEHIRVINDPYTQLAFLIMRADAAWYTAKVTKDAVDRRRQYSLAKKRYSELLEKGTVALTSNDTSLLKILEKLCTVLAEYPDQQDSQLKNFCWQTLRNAEAANRLTTIDDESTSMIHGIKEMLECCDFFY